MKKLEELGISPTPWKCATDDNGEVVGIENGRECGSSQKTVKWPTPCRSDFSGAGKTGKFRDRLDYAVERGRTKSKVYPTPWTNGMCGGSGAGAQMGRLVRDGKMTDKERHQIGAVNGGKLNPDWDEWLMGWPIGWTELRQLETDKYQSWLQGRFAN